MRIIRHQHNPVTLVMRAQQEDGAAMKLSGDIHSDPALREKKRPAACQSSQTWQEMERNLDMSCSNTWQPGTDF